MLVFLKKRFSPFRHSNFTLFFFAQGFSLVGTWSHELARSWLILDMVGTATALGALLLCTAIPGLFLTLWGGTLADRTDTRKLLMATKTILTISAFSLFLITNSGHLRPWMLMFFAVVEGFVNSFDGPAFTSLFARLTPREDFQQSLAIQSMGFHVSRMLGPTIAGLIIGFKNPAYVFLFDAISYLGVIYMISRAKLRDKESHGPPVQNRGVLGLLDGLKFFFQEPKMRYLQLQLLAGLMIVIPLSNVVFRSFLKEKFHLPASQFGYLFSFPGLGAMVGALYFTLAALKRPSKNLIVGIPALILTLLCVRTVPSPLLAAVLLGFTGFFIYLCVASLTQSMHLATPDDYRGRLGALITLGFNSVSPLMSFPVGVYTDKYGFESSILHLTLVFGGLSLLLAYSNMIENRRII